MLQRWNGIIAFEGVETRDHRIIDEFRWDESLLPMNFSCQFIRAEGHDGADTSSANMDSITRVGNQILAGGEYMDTPAGEMAAKLCKRGALSAVSVTPGSAGGYRQEFLDPNGNLVSLDQVIEMDDAQRQMLRARDHWDWVEIGGLTQVDVSAFAGSRIALVEADHVTVGLAASVARELGHNPDHFKKLALRGPTRMQLGPRLADGTRRVFGHAADRNQCHRSFENRCVNIDFDSDDYKDFHTGSALLSDGSMVAAKGITFGDLHAPDGAFSYAEIQKLIEDTGCQFGVVRVYPDEFGLQVCGIAFADLSDSDADRIRAGVVSVDARVKRGQMKLFGLHVVVTGGLPVTADEDSDGNLLRVVASAAVDLPVYDAKQPLELALDATLDDLVVPCSCGDGDDITVPELADNAPDLAVSITDAVLDDLRTDMALETATAGLVTT